MRDERIKKLAWVLVDYSVGAGEGDQVLVSGGVAAEPLIKEVYVRLLDVGAVPIPQVQLPGMQELFFGHAKEHHYEETPSIVRSIYEGADAFVFEAMALDEDDPVRYWREKAKEQGRLIKRLEQADEVRISGPGTDLTLSIKGRQFLNGDGTHHMPCGEIFTGPVEDSVNGEVYFGIPVAVAGREVSGVKLRFENGKVVESGAEKGEEYLNAMLDADEGSRYLGELGIGTNYSIPRATKNILFDEKLGGTVHLAVGRSYEKTGGKNESSVHWDLICDLREGGELYADGELLQKNGEFPEYDFG